MGLEREQDEATQPTGPWPVAGLVPGVQHSHSSEGSSALGSSLLHTSDNNVFFNFRGAHR